jgi:hypothetical protein
MKKNTVDITKFKLVLATREIASFIVEAVKKDHYDAISLSNAISSSRSFLDELYVLCEKSKIEIIDIPKNILPLYELIKKTHIENKMYAPEINVTISNKTFA